MMEQQLSIEDYNANGEVIDKVPCVDVTNETVAAEPTALEDLTKEELIVIINNLHRTIESVQITLENERNQNKVEYDRLNNFYKDRINEKTTLINYYERKFKILREIITIEEGEK